MQLPAVHGPLPVNQLYYKRSNIILIYKFKIANIRLTETGNRRRIKDLSLPITLPILQTID